jgi:proton-translocating NADH-quinone oxidoreductase chain L
MVEWISEILTQLSVLVVYIVCLPLLCFIVCGLFGRFVGIEGIYLIVNSCFISLNICVVACWYAITNGFVVELNLMDWINIADNIHWCLFIDQLTSEMLLIVGLISYMILIYSFGYMSSDPHLIRFISYLVLFTFFMVVLVTGGTLVQIFIGWEGVGLVSYLLVNFWFLRLEANRSALKAIIFNRVGDVGLVVGIILMVYISGSTQLSLIFASADNNQFVSWGWLIGLMLFIGAVGKSAQLGLHAWLPDAMEGPTPVSALLHSATMVTAGVYVLLRMNIIYLLNHDLLNIIAVMGCLTAIFGSTTALFQFDIKKIIAYSTCSQLGLMMGVFGIGNMAGCFFHLINHAFFKALLFLTAGIIIHALYNEQDIRKMGGLFGFLPFAYMCMLIGSLSLAGFPFLTGFYSKEFVLFYGLTSSIELSRFVGLALIVASVCTALYSVRLLVLVFGGDFRGFRRYCGTIGENDILMTFACCVLVILSIFVGYINSDRFIGLGSLSWFGVFRGFEIININLIEAEVLVEGAVRYFLLGLLVLCVIIYWFFGHRLVWLFNMKSIDQAVSLDAEGRLAKYISRTAYIIPLGKLVQRKYIYDFFVDKWMFAGLYQLITRGVFNSSYLIIKTIDRGLIDRSCMWLIRFVERNVLIFNDLQVKIGLVDYFAFMIFGVLLGLLLLMLSYYFIVLIFLGLFFVYCDLLLNYPV